MLQSFEILGLDLIFLLMYLSLILVANNQIKKAYHSTTLIPFFYFGWLFKVLFSLMFSSVYLFIVGGGDINAYWKGACCLADLFYSNPEAYFSELWHTERTLGIAHHFNSLTGYPPGWIWREEEAWFATKAISLFAIITFKGFWTTTLLISTLGFWVNWLLAVKLDKNEGFSRNTILAALFFIPSVGFWCSGISKDSLALMLTIFLIYQFFNFLKWEESGRFLRIFLILCLVYLTYLIRHYLAYAIGGPFILAFVGRYGKRFVGRPLFLWIFRLTVYIVLIIVSIIIIDADQSKALLMEANITKSDFSLNPIYSGAKYDMPTFTGSAIDLLSIFPLAIYTALFRPTFLDNVGLSFIINQVESLLFLFLVIRFVFRKTFFKQLNALVRDEFLLYILVFVLLVSFMAGYSSILFGVLVRIRSVALPFLILLLFRGKGSSETST
ncbi:MAG: hypothetical protein FJZ80_07085 [Bacteroidetes bacterium]|nr:hypothetical protein [Bacteroidota bacterium]